MTLAAKNLHPDFNIGASFAFDWLAATPTSRCWESYSGIEDYGQKAAIKKGRAISDPASDSSDSPSVDYSEYLFMKDQFQPAGFNPSKYDFGD